MNCLLLDWKILENTHGIYSIVSKSTGRRLVGQTKQGFRTRAKQHLSLLKRKIHENPFLQNHTLKHGFEDLYFEILEITDDVDNREIFWIEKYNTLSRPDGFNLRAGGGRGLYSDELKQKVKNGISSSIVAQEAKKKQAALLGKPINLVSPDGVEFSFPSNRAAARKLNVSGAQIYALKTGISSHVKGWKLNAIDKQTLKKTKPVILRYRLTHENGEIVDCPSLKDFAKERGLSKNSLSAVILGRQISHKGWKVVRLLPWRGIKSIKKFGRAPIFNV